MADKTQFIYIPAQASSSDKGPWYSIHSGLVTGIYAQKDWNFVKLSCKSAPAREHTDPCWGKFQTWNQAVWHCKRGVELALTSSLNVQEMTRPPRYIQSAEVLSTAWPAGSTIVVNDDDIILPYTGHEALPVTLTIMPLAGVHLGQDGIADPLPVPTPAPAPAPTSAPAPALTPVSVPTTPPLTQPLLSPLSSQEVRTRLDTRSMVQAARMVSNRRALSPPPPTLIDPSSRSTSPFASTAGSSQASGWAYHQSTYVESPSFEMLTPNHSPERHPIDNTQHTSSLGSVFSETHRRLHALRHMRVEDHELEGQITAHLILCLLAMANLSAEGIEEIKNVVAGL